MTALVAVIVAGLCVIVAVPRIVDHRINGVAEPPPYRVSARARALHSQLFVADLHGDTLLWDRDLTSRHTYGHIDLPRLAEGHVSLQVFSAVTKTPRGLNFERNASTTDNITLLAIASRWPPRTWNSLLERALYLSQKLHREEVASRGALHIVRSKHELASFLKADSSATARSGQTAALLALEGLHPLEGKLENVDTLFDAGFRMAGLTHFFDNEVGGSAHGVEKGGLTPFGRRVVRRLEEDKIVVDLAHASPNVIADVLAMAHRPVVVSHTGVQATCPGPRNLSDAQIRAIAASGGIIGIGYFSGAVCQETPAAIVKAMRHVATLVGVQPLALGSDFDGGTSAAFDASGVVLITQGLLDAGFSEADVAAIMGGNAARFLQSQLP